MKKLSLITLILLLSSCGLHYSEGDRAGYVRKLSKRGIIFKTWEGELVQQIEGVMVADTFRFTVKNEKLIDEIKDAMDKEQKIKLIYDQNIYISSFHGDTNHFIRDIEIIKNLK